MKFITNCTIWLYFFLLMNLAKGQTSSYNFDHITTANGLSNNKVESIIQDSRGFYWIATANGLNRFDGSSFKVYFNNPDDSTSLTHNSCYSILEDKNGDIWITTYKGVSRFLRKKGYFQQIYLNHPSINFDRANRTSYLISDRDGNIWFSGYGLWKYDLKKEKLLFYQHINNDSTSLSKNSISIIVFDERNNGIWIRTENNINYFNISEDIFYNSNHNPLRWKVFEYKGVGPITLDTKNRLWFQQPSTQSLFFFDIGKNSIAATRPITKGVRRLCVDDKNRIWICFWTSTAEIYDPDTKITDTGFFAIRHPHSLMSKKARNLYIDKQKNYWISSEQGISIFNERNQFYKLYQTKVVEKRGAEAPFTITSLAQTDPENLWIGSNLGLYKFNLGAETLRKVPAKIFSQKINTLLQDGDMLWVGLNDRVLCIDVKNEIIVKTIILGPGIFFIRKGTHQDLWVGLWTGGLYRVNITTADTVHFSSNSAGAPVLKTNALITGLVDGDNVWLGYNGGNGFAKYNISSNKIFQYHPQQKDSLNPGAGTITVISNDPTGTLWIGTHGGGFFQYEPGAGKYKRYNQQNGLNSNFINSILPDRQNNLWVSTADGMNYFNMQKKVILKMDIGLIFPDNDFRANGINGVNNRLYFFCQDQFVEIDPAAYRPYTGFPEMVIRNFKIFDKEVSFSDSHTPIELSHNQNFFSFEYSALKINPAEEIRYAYMLEGFDKTWNDAGYRQYASYTNVPAGSYMFKVKATNTYGQWSNTLISIPVNIHPPFWKTWWFITVSGLVFVAIILALFRYRINQLKRVMAIRTRISQDLHDDIGATLSSIHIYSSVAEKALQENPAKAKQVLQQINLNTGQVMEKMSDIVWALNSTHDGRSFTNRIKNFGYDLLAANQIECNYDIDEKLAAKITNPEARKNLLLIIKEAMNNISKYSCASRAEISMGLKNNLLELGMIDNGKGFEMEGVKKGNGLTNINYRTQLLKGNCSIETAPGKGVIITCRFPLTIFSNK